MEFIERLPLRELHYLNEMDFNTFKLYCYQGFKNDKERWEQFNILKKFTNSYILNNGINLCCYDYSQYNIPEFGGRLFCGKSIQGINCKFRGLLMKHTTDIDMKNAHPTILQWICNKHNIKCLELTYYIQNRENILLQFNEFNDRDKAKKTYLSSINDNKINKKVKFQHFKDFDKEMKRIQKEIMKIEEYKPLYLSVPDDKKDNIEGSGLNRILCMYENRILQKIIPFLKQKNIDISTLMFDGLMVFGFFYDNKELLKQITSICNTDEFIDLNMKWDYKEHDNSIIIPDEFIIPEKQKDYILTNEETERSFENFVVEFEKNHCKIINKAFFMKQTSDEYIPLSLTQLTTAYSHEYYLEKVYDNNGILTGTKKKKFLTYWLSYEYNIKKFEDVKVFPNKSLCPSNIFNLWKPFAMELLTDEYEPNIEGRDILLNHIKVLCNYDDVIYNYLIAWIAQMIQFPEVKSICPVLISKQGAGKGTFLQLMSKMLGSSKYFETTSPSRDVWGQFNGRMASAFLVNLNELSKKDTIEVEGYIKGLITDSHIFINNKGVNGFEIPSFHRFIITTNKDDGGIRTCDDDRRNVIIRSSDDKIGDKEYFNKMYELLEDINVIRTCYDYFKNIKGMKDFGKIPLPVTEYQKNLKELSRSPEESWLIDFTTENDHKEEVENLGIETYNEFKNWCINNGLESYNTNCVKLGVKLINMNISGIKKGRKTKKGDTKIFNIKKIKKHFGIGVLEVLINKIKGNDDDVEVENEL
jgi:hypothetical protein